MRPYNDAQHRASRRRSSVVLNFVIGDNHQSKCVQETPKARKGNAKTSRPSGRNCAIIGSRLLSAGAERGFEQWLETPHFLLREVMVVCIKGVTV